MKKLKNIFLTIVFSSIIIFFLFDLLIGNFDPLDDKPNVLYGVGNLFLLMVYVVTSISMFALLFFIPWLIYLRLKKDISISDKIVEYKNTLIIIVGSITLLSIAGVQLRSLKKTDITTDASTKIQESSSVKLKKDYFYFDTTKNDWVETSKLDYIKKGEIKDLETGGFKQLIFSSESMGYTRFFKDTIINGKNIIKMVFKKNMPKLKYFIFENDIKKEITKNQFGNYLKADSLVTYEEY